MNRIVAFALALAVAPLLARAQPALPLPPPPPSTPPPSTSPPTTSPPTTSPPTATPPVASPAPGPVEGPVAPAPALVEVPLPPPPVPKPRPPVQRPPKVAVLDFALAGSAHPDLARVLGDAAARGAAEDKGVQVMSQGEIVALLGLERTRQMLGCTDDQGCVLELGSALDSDRLVSGALTILDRTALVTVRLIDARKARTLSRTSATLVDATEAELVESARRLAHEALTGRKLDTTGLVRIQVNVKGAEVSLDGKSLGASPIAAPQRVLEGPHSLVVQKPGFIRWSGTISVAPGAEVPVQAELVPIQVVSERARSRLWAWAWTSTGVFALSATGGVTFGRMAESSYDAYKTATTRSQATQLHDEVKSRSLLANVSWGIAGASAGAATWLFISALREDARAAREAGEAMQRAAAPVVVPVEGGAVVGIAGRF